MNQLQTNPLRETKKSFKEIPLSSLLFHLALARHSPCGCSEQVSKSQRSLKYYACKKKVFWVHGRWWNALNHSKGPENLKNWSLVTSLWTKSSFTRKSSSLAWTWCSMCAFTPCQYYPHPPSQRFPFLINPPSHAREPHVLSKEVRPWRACLNHLSRISHWRQWLPQIQESYSPEECKGH